MLGEPSRWLWQRQAQTSLFHYNHSESEANEDGSRLLFRWVLRRNRSRPISLIRKHRRA